jgi:cytochrome c553
LTKKDQLDKDYQNFTLEMERLAKQEIKEIQEKTNAVREQTRKIGEEIELSLNDLDMKALKKKVNT